MPIISIYCKGDKSLNAELCRENFNIERETTNPLKTVKAVSLQSTLSYAKFEIGGLRYGIDIPENLRFDPSAFPRLAPYVMTSCAFFYDGRKNTLST